MNFLKKNIALSIKKILLQQHQIRLEKIEQSQLVDYLEKIKFNKKIFILDGCDHMNLGDQAILMSEIKFLKDHFEDYKLVNIGLNKFSKNIKFVKKYIDLEDIIVLHGGGNLGNQYKRAESTRRTIIEMFPNNKIILFPQTMYFTNDEDGKKELRTSRNIYGGHKKLIFIAREKTSYELMRENFERNTVLLTPDIVLYLNKSANQQKRRGALLCCRRDVEGLLSEDDKNYLLNCLLAEFSKVIKTDTVGENSFKGVEKKFQEFKSAQLVITDRLHGMVFAAITGTPCITLSNYNYKVRGTYEWIKHLKYIKYAENIAQIPELILELKNLKESQYNNDFAMPYYKQIADIMK